MRFGISKVLILGVVILIVALVIFLVGLSFFKPEQHSSAELGCKPLMLALDADAREQLQSENKNITLTTLPFEDKISIISGTKLATSGVAFSIPRVNPEQTMGVTYRWGQSPNHKTVMLSPAHDFSVSIKGIVANGLDEDEIRKECFSLIEEVITYLNGVTDEELFNTIVEARFTNFSADAGLIFSTLRALELNNGGSNPVVMRGINMNGVTLAVTSGDITRGTGFARIFKDGDEILSIFFRNLSVVEVSHLIQSVAYQ